MLTLLAALAVQSPASALASSSPSAGDNQYTDPLATSPPQPTTAPAPTTSSSPATTSSTQATSQPAPTSTTASSASTGPAAASDPAPQLPYTGDDVWLLAAAGAGIAGAGVVLRRRAGAR